MESTRRTGRWIAWLATAAMAACIAGQSSAADAPKRYALERSGFLQLKVPAGWRDEVDTSAKPPAINFRPADGKPFIVTLILAQAPRGTKAPSTKHLRAEVEQMAHGIRRFSVEGDKVKLKHIIGSSGQGFEFFATDAAPAAGEFKYMTRGKLVVGNDVTITFTVLTNEGQEAVIRSTESMLKSALRTAK